MLLCASASVRLPLCVCSWLPLEWLVAAACGLWPCYGSCENLPSALALERSRSRHGVSVSVDVDAHGSKRYDNDNECFFSFSGVVRPTEQILSDPCLCCVVYSKYIKIKISAPYFIAYAYLWANMGFSGHSIESLPLHAMDASIKSTLTSQQAGL